MDAPTQSSCVSQQQTEEKTTTSVSIQSETSVESKCNPSVGEKRTTEMELEQKQNTLSNQPSFQHQHVQNSAVALQSFQNDVAQSKQTHVQSIQTYVHTLTPHTSFRLSPLLKFIVPSFCKVIF
jgi:hypothetical protein